jgi:hypothetical protein
MKEQAARKKIKPEFDEKIKNSSTGANDAHQSLNQSMIYSAQAEAMKEAIVELSQDTTVSKKELRKLKKKKQNTEVKAKRIGETHHKNK